MEGMVIMVGMATRARRSTFGGRAGGCIVRLNGGGGGGGGGEEFVRIHFYSLLYLF